MKAPTNPDTPTPLPEPGAVLGPGPVSGVSAFGSRLTAEAAEVLAAELAGEMIRRWQQGERPLPEDLLVRHPELWEHPEAAADLIYEELCLRQEYGPVVPTEQVLARFPQWRQQLEVLLDCQRLLGPCRAPPQFPSAGEPLGDFLLLAELGRGAHGRVFLASQLTLGDRPVVLKVTPAETCEHLSLARLQHTHIVPLYSIQDLPGRGLLALCMPYFGGATLAQLLDALQTQSPPRRTGAQLLDALDRVQARVLAECGRTDAECSVVAPTAPRGPHARGPARRFLARAGYVEVVCWIGACLADALQYAHERGLVHLDLKPSNVLLAADGQPMVLDFHLAREPIDPEGEPPHWLGGTAGYMSPEQHLALLAVEEGRKVPRPVDGRSDVYSLGVVLYEALGGRLPAPAGIPGQATTVKVDPATLGRHRRDQPPPLNRLNPRVSVGLADVIGKCLAADPGQRYPGLAALAVDLRRHLADLPLAGVRNRSVAERWRKWRRRRPHGAALAGMMLAVLTAAAAVALGAATYFSQRIEQARAALNDGQVEMAKGDWEGAIATLQRGRSLARGVPFPLDVAEELDRGLGLAQQGRAAAERAAAARELHQLADRVRFLYGADHSPTKGLRRIEASCRAFWENRDRIVERLSPAGGPTPEPAVRDDLLDLAIFWADLQVRLAPPAGQDEARHQALTVLAQAEALFGPSPVLDAERKLHGGTPRFAPRPLDSESSPETAWEHYALGRVRLRTGDLRGAAEEVARAVRLQPQGLWPNFYQGLCAYRLGRYADAATAYSVCIGAAPGAAGCFYNRALAWDALGRTEQALADYDEALRLDPALAVAALNRGLLHYRAQRLAAALADLQRARDLGAAPALASLALALVNLARGERAAALDDLRRALSHDPDRADAHKLHDSLLSRERRRPGPSTTSRSPGATNSAPAPERNFR